MNRAEHLQWCKERAIKFCDDGNISEAILSFVSDMGKHEKTADHPALTMMFGMQMVGTLSTPEEVKHHIEGFA